MCTASRSQIDDVETPELVVLSYTIAGTGSCAVAVTGLVFFAMLWLHYVLFEVSNDGQTPGKRIMRFRVVQDGGLAVTIR